MYPGCHTHKLCKMANACNEKEMLPVSQAVSPAVPSPVALDEPKFSLQERNFGRGKSVIQSLKHKLNCGRKLPVSPECMKVAYDITFFTIFAGGWLITFIWNREFVLNNPILVYFGNNNVCVGFDSFPARFVTHVSCADPLSPCVHILYSLASVLTAVACASQSCSQYCIVQGIVRVLCGCCLRFAFYASCVAFVHLSQVLYSPDSRCFDGAFLVNCYFVF